MTNTARIRLAAAVTVLFLAGISAAGLALRDEAPTPAAASASRGPAATPAPTTARDPSPSLVQRGDDEHAEEFEDDE